MSEADVNSLLPGYHIDQLREVWGKPDSSENSTACWKLGNDTTLVVSYKNNGIDRDGNYSGIPNGSNR